jgi:hypothetical protein
MMVEPADARSRHPSHTTPAEETAPKPHGVAAAPQPPLPQPRPVEAPGASTAAAKDKDKAKDASGKEDNKGDDKAGDAKGTAKEDAKNSGKAGKDESAAQAPPAPSACRLALTEEIAIAPSVPAIQGPGACGGDDLVRLEAVVLPNKKRVALTPAGIMRCTMATAVASWIRDDVAPEVAKLGSEITTLDNFDSYECRGRNGVPSAHLSEHGKANAIDVHGFKLADGRLIDLTDRTQPRDFREAVLHSACTRFPTVLGPDSDWHHEDHIHVDLIERRSNYRICQWDVLDPMPKVAPLTPEVRPDAAPSREVAETPKPEEKANEPTKDRAATKPGASQPSDTKNVKPDDAASPDKPGNDKAGNEKAGNDSKDAKAASVKAPSAASEQKSATPKPESSTDRAARSPAQTDDKDKPQTRATIQPDKAAAERATPNKASTDKPSTEKATTDSASTKQPPVAKPSPEKASTEKGAAERASGDKASRKKVAADKPAKKRRHRGRTWNPFASFF